jgi:transcriptional regulator with XRE-family HTH domain
MATKKPLHVLRTTRKLYKFSQQKLATLVGCSLSTVKFVETGRLRPSADLAHRVYLQTGLDPQQLLGNFSPDKPRDPCGVLLTTETIKLRQDAELSNEQAREQVDSSLQLYAAVLQVLLDVSVRKRKLWALRPALQTALDKLVTDFDLAKDFRRTLSTRYGVRDPWTVDGYSPTNSLYMLVNGPLSEMKRTEASAKRNEFYGEIPKLPARKTITSSAA